MNFKLESKEIMDLIIEINKSKRYDTDKGSVHTYTGIYEGLLSKYRNEKINFLEIGVKNGGSMLLWSQYLPNALFSFSDINSVDDEVIEKVGRNRCSFYLGDAYEDDIVNTINVDNPDGFDFIVDDGPHSLDSQIKVINKYLPLLKKEGIMVIEDIQRFEWCDKLINEIPSSYDYEIVDFRYNKKRYDDVVIIITKK